MSSGLLVPSSRPLREQDPTDSEWRVVELVQRGRILLDVAEADLNVAEAHLGPFHETTWYFRHGRDEAARSWQRLRAELGSNTLEAALKQLPIAVLSLRRGRLPDVRLIVIQGRTYFVESAAGTELAPVQFRLTRLPGSEHGLYYVCRLRDRSFQCDCAGWTYQVAEMPDSPPCKHITALTSLGWL